MATCEVYVPSSKDVTPSPEQEIAVLELETRIPAARQAGLTAQAGHLENELAIRRLGLVPLSAEQLQQWRTWFPTGYRTEYLHCDCGRAHPKPPTSWGQRSLADYNFDRVPESVLKLITRMRDEHKLDWIEIRTPEKARSQDPGLFGGKGNVAALFGRWGESDERLISFEEIRAGLAARADADTWRDRAGVLTAFAAFIGCMFFAQPRDLTGAITSWAFAAVLLSAVAIGFWQRSKIRRIFAYAFR